MEWIPTFSNGCQRPPALPCGLCCAQAISLRSILDHLAEAIPPDPGKRRILILDNASWHKSARLTLALNAFTDDQQTVASQCAIRK
jgi:hypothetical protein